MKKIAAILLALLLIPAALADTYTGDAFVFELPEGFALAQDAGYLEAASADAGAALEGAMLALSGEKSISAVHTDSEAADAQAAALAVIEEYAAFIPGFENVAPEPVQIGERAFVRVRFAVDGAVAQQFFLAEGGKLFVITCMGMAEDEAEAALAGFETGGV